jgi:hypothetical protein
MVKIQTGNELGTAILKALGITEKGVLRVQIDCQSNELATVTLIRVVGQDEQGKLLAELDGFVLDRKPEDPNVQAMETVARNLLKAHDAGSGR